MRAVASTPVALVCAMRDAVAGDLAVAELLLLDVAQAGDHVVAERTGGVDRVRLDQRDVEALVVALRHARRGESGEAAADDDDLRCAPLGRASGAAASTRRRRRRRRRRSHGGSDEIVSRPPPFYFCAPYQAAIAWISSGVKPFTIRSMIVALRCPLRNSASAATIFSGSRPTRRGGVAFSAAVGEWQPEHDVAPGGASAASAARGHRDADESAHNERKLHVHGRLRVCCSPGNRTLGKWFRKSSGGPAAAARRFRCLAVTPSRAHAA